MAKSIGDFDYVSASDYNNAMIVDGLNLAFRFKHANKKNFSIEYLKLVQSLAKSYEAKDIFILGDGGSAYRKEIYPEYKANREKLRAQQTEEESQEFLDFLEEFQTTFDLLASKGFHCIKFKGVEADDIAAYITNSLISKEYPGHIWLISSDKDWDLLIDEQTSRFSYRTRKETTIDNWSEHYAYDPDDHISIKVIMGDKGDNVPGVEGIGEKRAYTVLRQFGPTAFDVWEALPINDSKKYIQNLNEFGDQLLTNYELMDLRSYANEALLGHAEEVDKHILKVFYEN